MEVNEIKLKFFRRNGMRSSIMKIKAICAYCFLNYVQYYKVSLTVISINFFTKLIHL